MITVTVDNVSMLLAKIGCKAEHDAKGAGWYRVYIHAPQPGSDIPMSLGRVMFQHGEYMWTRWYDEPHHGDIGRFAIYDFRWAQLLNTGAVPSDEVWHSLVQRAQVLAHQKVALRHNARRALNAGRMADGKKPRTNKLAPPNVWGAVYQILREEHTA